MSKKAIYYLVISLVIFFLIFEILYYFSGIRDFERIIALESNIVITLGVVAGVIWLYKKID